jgi:hypothetical protein
MREFVPLLAVAVVAVPIGFSVGWMVANTKSATRLENVVAMSRDDGKYGPGFYGAHVYLEPQASGYSAQARVFVGRGNDSFHDCGELGSVATDADAVARWERDCARHAGSGNPDGHAGRSPVGPVPHRSGHVISTGSGVLSLPGRGRFVPGSRCA